MRAFKILVMESISIHGSRSIQVKKNPKEMHVANIRTFYVTARVRLHLHVESFVFSVANSPPLHAFSWLHLQWQWHWLEKRVMNLVEIFGIPSNQQIITALPTSRKPPTYRDSFLLTMFFYRIEFSFIQIMNSFFRAARKREVCSYLSTADSANYYRLC